MKRKAKLAGRCISFWVSKHAAIPLQPLCNYGRSWHYACLATSIDPVLQPWQFMESLGFILAQTQPRVPVRKKKLLDQ